MSSSDAKKVICSMDGCPGLQVAEEQVDCHVCGAPVHKACFIILKEQNLMHINELCSILCFRYHGSDEIDSSEVTRCREEFVSYNKTALKNWHVRRMSMSHAGKVENLMIYPRIGLYGSFWRQFSWLMLCHRVEPRPYMTSFFCLIFYSVMSWVI